MIGQREETGQRVGVQLRKLSRRHPFQEGAGRLRVLGFGVHAEGDVGMIADVALVRPLRQRRRKRPHLELRLLVEHGNVPRPRRIDRRFPQREQLLRVRVCLRFKAVGQVWRPLRQRFPHRYVLRVGEFLRPLDQP